MVVELEDSSPPPDPAKMNSATTSDSTGGAYVPRWKRDANVKPEPYKAGPKNKAPRAPLEPGQYSAPQMRNKLGSSLSHSFLVSRRHDKQAYPGSSEDGSPISADERLKLSKPKEVLYDPPPSSVYSIFAFTRSCALYRRAILNYTGANPPATEPGTYIIWTRHNVDTVKSNVGQAYPFFTCKSHSGPRMSDNIRVFTFDGHYRIDSADFATKEEVLEFVKAREQSKGDKPASVWFDKINSSWLKVLLRKAPEQLGNPMD